ncbi:hypothetical protein D3C85_1712900 [compost metagenome]
MEMALAPSSPAAHSMNFLASSEWTAFLFTAKAVGEPNVVTLPSSFFCGIGARPQLTLVLPSFLACRMPATYQVPMGIMAAWPLSNMVR